MSNENRELSYDKAVKAAMAQDKRALRGAPYYFTPDAADRTVEEFANRYVPFPNGIVRATDANGRLLPMDDTAQPRAAFLGWLGRGVSDEDRTAEGLRLRDEVQESLMEEKMRSGLYGRL